MDEFLDMDLGEGAPSYSESERYRNDSRLWWWRPPTWLCSTRGALDPAAPAIGDEEVPPPPASTSKLKKEGDMEDKNRFCTSCIVPQVYILYPVPNCNYSNFCT